MFGISDFRKKLRAKLQRKAYRDAYVGEHVRRWIANQIRALRDDPRRGWSQGEFSRRLGKPQSVVSRLEDPSYGKMTVNTLLEVASACDVALIVKFVDYPKFVEETRDLTPAAMQVADFEHSNWGQGSFAFSGNVGQMTAGSAETATFTSIADLRSGAIVNVVPYAKELTAMGTASAPDRMAPKINVAAASRETGTRFGRGIIQ